MREFVVTIIGLLVASLATALVVGVIFVVGGNPVGQLPVVIVIASSFSLAPAFVFGGILFVALRSFNLIRWWSAALGGVAVGTLVGTLFPSGTGALSLLATSVLVGAVSGLAFWATWSAGMRSKSLSVKDRSSSDVPAA